MRAFAQVAAATVLTVCLCDTARPQSIQCQDGQKQQQMAELIFGRGIRARGLGVSDNDWMLFVDDEITPRFPDGLTVFEAAGQWRDRTSNKIFRERSRIALIILPGDAQDLARLNEITDAYKRRFRQQSVVVIIRPACVSF
jgi:hypothetical protein